MRTALLLLAALNLLDVLTTWVGLGMGMPEVNLLPVAILATWGTTALWAFKAAVIAGVIGAVWRGRHRYPRLVYGVHVSNVLLALVVASNLVQLGM